MASDHLRPQSPLYPRRAASTSSNVFSQTFHEDTFLDEEDRVLRLLLEAFPGISHETLAIAYARANRDPNKAAEILSAETRTRVSKDPGKDAEILSAETRTRVSRDPDKAAEILSAETRKNAKVHAQSSDLYENRGGLHLMKGDPFLEEKYGPLAVNRPSGIYSDDISFIEADTQQLTNGHGHGDVAGASVRRDAPTFANHSRPPEPGTEPLKASAKLVKPRSPDEDGNRVVSFPAVRRNDLTRSNKPNWSMRSSSAPPKLSAVAGSVSNRMQRRASGPVANGNSSELAIQGGVEVDDGLYSEKMVKKKKRAEDGNGWEDRRRAAEDFLHSMLGGDFGIDLVRDVLAHYGGDTEKALETLLNITASGFDYGGDDVHRVDPLFAALEINEEIKQPSGAFLQDKAGLETDQATDDKALVVVEEDRSHRFLLVMLCHEFPAVEQSFLGQVLQAAAFSYEGALEILKESGMTPASEQNSKPKLDPNEVLRSLFKTEHAPPAVAGPFNEPLVNTDELLVAEDDEPWSLVAAKPRSTKNPETQIQKVRCNTNSDPELDQYNEYYRHRASANEHWESMKTYMKEANAAYSRGDGARAGLLSEKGAKFKELAQAASNRASQNIFNVRNKHLPNNITIDLHSQHVAEALSLLQLHLRTLSRIPSVHGLTVITGQGSHSAGGQAKIKPAVTRYLDKKQVPWTQENPGCVVINMCDVRGSDASYAESYSDGE